MQPPPEPEQTVQVVNLGPGPDPGTALSGHTFEVYDRQFREWHMWMVCACWNLARQNLSMANDQQHIVIFWPMDRPITLDGPLLSQRL
jgi:hypothetical protein